MLYILCNSGCFTTLKYVFSSSSPGSFHTRNRCHSSISACVIFIPYRFLITEVSQDIRDVHDAHVLLEAVRLNVLPLLKRRLLASERDELQSGHIYVWEEAQDDGGLLRWTDGRRWYVYFPLFCVFHLMT